MLREYLNNFMLAYVDNIIIFSNDLNEYYKYVRIVL